MARKTSKTADRGKGAKRKSRKRGEIPSRGKSRRSHGLLRWLFKWSLIAGIWGGIILAGTVAWFAYDLPDVGRIAEITRRPSVTLLASDGSRLSSFGDVYGESVRLQDLPAYLPRAVMAVEDRRFYEHFGVDPLGLARAVRVNVRAGRIVQGGSTITQQLAKILFLTPDRTIKRKVQELLLALWLEHKFSKDQILTLYLNRVYLGAGAYGVDAAAERYFDKPAAQVSLYEAALLAGLLKAPSRYNPARDAGLADSRAALALEAMVEADFVTPAEAKTALAAKERGRATAGQSGRYFADWVLQQVPSFVGAVDRDLVVVTTLDAKLQRIAEEEAAGSLDGVGKERVAGQAALVALAPDGAVRAMVGGRDYRESQFNRATQALRQPGSAFKAFVYLAAMERGHSPDDRIEDAPIKLGDWAPRNYNDRYYGEVTLREAFARSLNSAAVRLTHELGPRSVAAAARRLGITSELEETAGIALGASEVTLLELTSAYAAFANGGRGVWPFGITEIRDSSGQILYLRSGDGPGEVIRSRAVHQVTDLMRAAVVWGTGKAANPDRPAAGKTGTSQDFRDAWFVGFTADLVAGVWFGNDDGTPMKGVTGGGLPAQLWGRFMKRGLDGLSPRPLPGAQVVVATGAGAAQTDAQAPEARGQAEESEGFIGRILRALSLDEEESGANGSGRFKDGGPQR